MRLLTFFYASGLMTLVGCAHAVVAPSPSTLAVQSAALTPPAAEVPIVETAALEPPNSAAPAAETVPAVAKKDTSPANAVARPAEPEIDDGGDEADAEAAPVEEEGEAVDDSAAATYDGPRYSKDVSDEDLQRLWKESPEKLGSIAFGFAHEGRIINGVRFPQGDGAWTVVSPELSWGTQETIDYLVAAITEVKKRLPDAPPLRVNALSSREGGYLRPHKSHQNGRDVDLGFYYPTAETNRARDREHYIDVARNWELLKALVTLTDVQMILVDRRVQKVIYDYALKAGEDKGWLDSLFNGANALVKHARRHRDHFHVRFYNGRAQELGRRVAPLLALRPEQNLAMHRVRSGDTLGGIAARYGTSVNAIMKVNHMRKSFLRVKQMLKIPLHKACTQCPIPPAVLIPPRRLPPQPATPTA